MKYQLSKEEIIEEIIGSNYTEIEFYCKLIDDTVGSWSDIAEIIIELYQKVPSDIKENLLSRIKGEE